MQWFPTLNFLRYIAQNKQVSLWQYWHILNALRWSSEEISNKKQNDDIKKSVQGTASQQKYWKNAMHITQMLPNVYIKLNSNASYNSSILKTYQLKIK